MLCSVVECSKKEAVSAGELPLGSESCHLPGAMYAKILCIFPPPHFLNKKKGNYSLAVAIGNSTIAWGNFFCLLLMTRQLTQLLKKLNGTLNQCTIPEEVLSGDIW